MKVATRYCLAIVLLGSLATAATWSTWLAPEREDPCRAPDLLRLTGLIDGTRPSGQRSEVIDDTVIQWSEGSLEDEAFRFRIVRSYAVGKASERPLRLTPRQGEAEQIETVMRPTPWGTLPIQLVRTSGMRSFDVVAYLFVLGNEPVASPVLSLMRNAFVPGRRGRPPLTILLVSAPVTPDNVERGREIALQWVEDAWGHYRSVCVPSASETPGEKSFHENTVR